MGNYTSTVDNEKKADMDGWGIEISMKKGTTTISYTIRSDGYDLVKTVKGQSGGSIVFSVNPKTFEMTHGLDQSGTDGEANDLRAAIQNMAIVLKDRFQVEVDSESTNE